MRRLRMDYLLMRMCFGGSDRRLSAVSKGFVPPGSYLPLKTERWSVGCHEC